MSPEITDSLIQIVRDTARTEIMPHFRNPGADCIEAKTSASDLVTVADRVAEARITAEVAHLLPAAVIIGGLSKSFASTLMPHDLPVSSRLGSLTNRCSLPCSRALPT